MDRSPGYHRPCSQRRRRVFIGNVPYSATEKQLIDICEEIGPVVSLELVLDKGTGRHKGYGFCEYRDEETALSARRNLHDYEVSGRRLIVDSANNNKGGSLDFNDDSEALMNHRSKRRKLEEGDATHLTVSSTYGLQNFATMSTQFPPEIESALLQQVMNLTPDKLSSLPLDEQHQVLQLKQMILQQSISCRPIYA